MDSVKTDVVSPEDCAFPICFFHSCAFSLFFFVQLKKKKKERKMSEMTVDILIGKK